MRTDKTCQGGFGLLEMILVFILVTFAAAVVFTLWDSARQSADAHEAYSDLATLTANVQQDWCAYRNCGPANLTTAKLIAAHDVPASMLSLDGSTSSLSFRPWGASIVVGGVSPTAFSIVYNNLPHDKSCVQFLTAAAALFNDVNGGNNGTGPTTVIRKSGGRIDESAVMATCAPYDYYNTAINANVPTSPEVVFWYGKG